MKVTNYNISNHSKPSSSTRTLLNHAKAQQKSAKTQQKATKKKSAPKKTHTSQFSLGAFLSSPRMIQVYGILLLALSLLLFISIVSFYFHPNDDISHVTAQTSPHNIAGTVGAHLAYWVIEYTFGVISIGIPFLLFLYGMQISFAKVWFSPLKITISVILSMAWISMFTGLFFYNGTCDFISGSFGNYIAELLLAHTGKIVTVLILIVLLATILILCFDFSPKEIALKRQSKRSSDPAPKSGGFFNRKPTNQQAPTSISSQREDLPGLYIENRGALSKEYNKNVFEFEDDNAQKTPQPEPIFPSPDKPQPLFEDPFSEKTKTASAANFQPRPTPSEKEVPLEIIDNSLSFKEDTDENEPEEDSLEAHKKLTPEEIHNLPPIDPRLELSHFEFPPIDLLNDYQAKESTEELLRKELIDNKKRIETTLKSFNIPIKRITATVGPTVTLYEIVPDDGVRISKIKNLEDDIALSLSALGIRIIAPIPGRGTIGIEVPNKNPNIVSMKEIITSEKFKNNHYELPVGLGKTINNEAFVVDLVKMPHLLIAGATGQGKSVGLNAAITSLLYTKHPCEMKFVLIDPKKVEFTLYSAIENYYLAKLPDNTDAIITDTKKVVRTLNALCLEMDQRYDLLKLAKTRNIKEYNAKFCAHGLSPAFGHRYLPYIVLIIDEFGDLIMTAGREVEMPLARLAQLARAIGIHLIIATQRPSVNIITGSIKANFPARIAFRVSSKIDSRTILDSSGADQLIGKGDMLISTGSDLIRLQCAFVDTPEVEKIANFIEQQSELKPLLEPFELPDVPDNIEDNSTNNDDEAINSNELDPMFLDVATLIVQTQQGSTSFIQRRMKLGYNRAGRIMDQMEDFGVVGQANGSKAREVLIKTESDLREMFLQKGLL